MRFESGDGQGLLVEVEDHAYGVQQITRGDNGLIEAGKRLDEVLATARPTIRAVVDAIRELAPDEHQIEFGLKLNAEAGVMVAKTSMEGHFTVKLIWSRPTATPAATPPSATAPDAKPRADARAVP